MSCPVCKSKVRGVMHEGEVLRFCDNVYCNWTELPPERGTGEQGRWRRGTSLATEVMENEYNGTLNQKDK